MLANRDCLDLVSLGMTGSLRNLFDGSISSSDVCGLPLPSAKSLWEARIKQEWEAGKAMQYSGYSFSTFGELIEAHRQQRNAWSAQRMYCWQAGADKLGVMMDIAVELVACQVSMGVVDKM